MRPTVDFDEVRQLSSALLAAQNLAYPKSVATQSLRSAVRPLLRAEKQEIPFRSGKMRSDARILSVNNDKYYTTVLVGVSKKRGRRGKLTHLITRGTKARITRSGANRGKVTPDDFHERAWLQTKDGILQAFGDDYKRRTAAWLNNIRYRSGRLRPPLR